MEKKRRLISLMLAGVMATSVGAMAGCSNGSTEVENIQQNYYHGVENAYIILEQNGVDILHKGDMDVLYVDGGYDGGPTTDYNYKLDCGEETITNTKHQIFAKAPKAERYDQKCEDCFGK